MNIEMSANFIIRFQDFIFQQFHVMYNIFFFETGGCCQCQFHFSDITFHVFSCIITTIQLTICIWMNFKCYHLFFTFIRKCNTYGFFFIQFIVIGCITATFRLDSMIIISHQFYIKISFHFYIKM